MDAYVVGGSGNWYCRYVYGGEWHKSGQIRILDCLGGYWEFPKIQKNEIENSFCIKRVGYQNDMPALFAWLVLIKRLRCINKKKQENTNLVAY